MKLVKQIVIILCFGCITLTGQNNDSLFQIAQQDAYAKNYSKAESICKQLIKAEPKNTDYSIFLGRLYSWQNKFGASKKILKDVIETNPENTDAYDALTDAEMWSKDYVNAITHLNTAISKNKEQKENFLLKKAKVYDLMDDSYQALQTLNALLEEFPQHKEAQDLKNEIISKSYKNSISVSYLNVSFSNPSFTPWNFAYLEYMRRFKKFPVIARFNYGNLNNINGYQFELDAYPKLGKKMYAYLNAGYSNSTDIFPTYRAGAEIYRALPRAFEMSAGLRYMHFEAEEVVVFTAYFGKYYRNWWFAYRPFIVTKGASSFESHTAIIRRYLKNEDNYLSLNLIYGSTPYTTSSLQDFTRVNSQRIGIDAQLKIGKGFLIKPMFSYEYEEYYPQLFRNRFYSQIALTKRF